MHLGSIIYFDFIIFYFINSRPFLLNKNSENVFDYEKSHISERTMLYYNFLKFSIESENLDTLYFKRKSLFKKETKILHIIFQ
jgi:hypothetical protein